MPVAKKNKNVFDIAVIGCGPIGLAFASSFLNYKTKNFNYEDPRRNKEPYGHSFGEKTRYFDIKSVRTNNKKMMIFCKFNC